MKKNTGRKSAKKYGDEEMDAANRKVLDMTEEEYERFQNLGEEIRHTITGCGKRRSKPGG